MNARADAATSSRSMRFVRNVGASVVGQIAVMALSFVLTPRLVRLLGIETYGLYILLQTASSYLLLFTFGAGSATVKFAAEHAVEGGRGFRQTVKYSAAVHFFGALIGGLALAASARFAAQRLFHVPPPLVEPAVFVLRCAAAAAVFVALNQFATSLLQGLQRFDWQNAVVFLQNGLMVAGATALAAAGFGIKGAARWYLLWNGCVLLFSAAVTCVFVRRKWEGAGKPLRWAPFALFGLSMWPGSFAWLVTFQFDRLFIARAASLTALTLYSVPAGLLQRLQLLPAVISSVLVPMMSEVGGHDADETLRRMYVRAARFLFSMLFPALVLLFALMPQFLTLWLGGEFGERSVWPARVLVLAQAFLFLNYIPNSVAAGRGRPWYLSAVAWGQAIISLAAWAVLIKPYQLLGVAIGSLIAQAVPSIAYLSVVHSKILGLSWSRFFEQALLRPMVSAGLLLALVFPFHPLASTWPRMIGLVAAGGLLYYGSTWWLLDPEDRALWRKLVMRRS